MAIRADAAGDYLGRTASYPSYDPLTVCFWVRLNSDINATGGFFAINVGGADELAFVGVNSDGVTFMLYYGNAVLTGSALSTGTWYFVAATRNATSAIGYLDGVQDISGNPGAVTGTPSALRFLQTEEGLRIDGKMTGARIWEAELTAAEIQQEMYTLCPNRFANLWAWYPMLTAADVEDMSGNARDLTAAGTLTTEDGPPVSWGAPVWVPSEVAAAGGPTAAEIAAVATAPIVQPDYMGHSIVTFRPRGGVPLPFRPRRGLWVPARPQIRGIWPASSGPFI